MTFIKILSKLLNLKLNESKKYLEWLINNNPSNYNNKLILILILINQLSKNLVNHLCLVGHLPLKNLLLLIMKNLKMCSNKIRHSIKKYKNIVLMILLMLIKIKVIDNKKIMCSQNNHIVIVITILVIIIIINFKLHKK